MKKNITIIFLVSLITLLFAINSCNKSNYTKATTSNTKKMTCTINETKFKADSVSCWVDTVHHTIDIIGLNAQAAIDIKANYTYTDFDIALGTTTFGSGTVSTYFNAINYGVTHGNLTLKVNTDKTVSGTFFYRDDANINVSVGMYSKIPTTFY